ncbi:uncharacterized protein LOC132184532 [Corylus avellana]|uniref:uncharacterized protein LOC132184532 n=1 Tax=Corylus avellana TaxID=13451 RepID=UPI001E210223|nr:uncharacterized protein LOC132184532 [Corylus avellana]
MEECRDHKRTRVDDGVNSPESKRFHADSAESELNSPEAKRIHDDLLNILDDSDVVTDRDSAIQGLDSVIRSFEEEILVPSPAMAAQELTSDSGESQPELGYLLGASDDELGLPPTAASASGEEARIEAVDFETRSSDAVGLDGMLGFENEMRSYDSFEFGIGVDSDIHVNDGGSEFVPLGGLFDHSDVSEFSWRPESLPAL